MYIVKQLIFMKAGPLGHPVQWMRPGVVWNTSSAGSDFYSI